MKKLLIAATLVLAACSPESKTATVVAQNGKDADESRLVQLEQQLAINAANDSYLAQRVLVLEQFVSNMNSVVVNLNNSVTNLQTVVNNGQILMVKAPCSNSKEVFIKINGKYYAAMNINNCNSLDQVYLAELAINTLYVTTDGMSCKFKVLSNGSLQQQ